MDPKDGGAAAPNAPEVDAVCPPNVAAGCPKEVDGWGCCCCCWPKELIPNMEVADVPAPKPLVLAPKVLGLEPNDGAAVAAALNGVVEAALLLLPKPEKEIIN